MEPAVSKISTDFQGRIDPDSKAGKILGFTSDKFAGDSYLWGDDDRMWISFIVSIQQGKGHLSALFNSIEARGYYIAVPTPFAHMQQILKRKGFVLHYETTSDGDSVEVWHKPRPQTETVKSEIERQDDC